MKKLIFLMCALVPVLSMASVGTDQGNGTDPCEGPAFQYHCIVTWNDADSQNSIEKYDFSIQQQRWMFGKLGRYEIGFCPSQDKKGHWQLSISMDNIVFESQEIGRISNITIVPFDQKKFELINFVQKRNSDLESSIKLSCEKTK